MSSIDDGLMLIAIEEARIAKLSGDLPFGAVVVARGKVVGKGRARDGSTGDVTDHAELMALREACKTLGKNDLKECVIYCTNEPCVMCASGIFQAKIADVKIGLSRSDLSQHLRPRKLDIFTLAEDSGYDIKITKGILKEQILELFRNVGKE